MCSGSLLKAIMAALRFRPAAWFTYHSYYKSPDLIGPVVSRLFRIPYFLLEPMYGTKWRKNPETRAGFYINRFALKSAACVFANNLDDIPSLTRLLPQGRIHYIPPGIFPEEFTRNEAAAKEVKEQLGIGPGKVVILCVAMFRPGAKFESLSHLIRSLAPLAGRNDFVLVLAGDGPMRADITSMADSLLPGKTIFAGAVARERLYKYYSAADIFALPGIGESIGMAYLEAMSCGLPVIAINQLGAAQLIEHDKTGLLVSSGESSMTEAVERLLDDSALRKRLGANGSKYIVERRNLRKNYSMMLEKMHSLPPC